MTRKAVKNYSGDEVIKSLVAKGCTITTAKPITKDVSSVILPNEEKIAHKYNEWLKRKSWVASEKAFSVFQKTHAWLFKIQRITKTIVVQSPFTINIKGVNTLGNGSLGKIDFLANYKGFSVIK